LIANLVKDIVLKRQRRKERKKDERLKSLKIQDTYATRKTIDETE
jgi:hypothetical protein